MVADTSSVYTSPSQPSISTCVLKNLGTRLAHNMKSMHSTLISTTAIDNSELKDMQCKDIFSEGMSHKAVSRV